MFSRKQNSSARSRSTSFEMDETPTIKVRDNGPYLVTGTVRLIDAEGNPYEASGNFVLCRCGQSAEKPFCDGSHKTCGFSANSRAPKE